MAIRGRLSKIGPRQMFSFLAPPAEQNPRPIRF